MRFFTDLPAHLLVPFAADDTQSFARLLMVNREFRDATGFLGSSILEIAKERCRILLPQSCVDDETLSCFKLRQVERLAMGDKSKEFLNELVQEGILSKNAYDRGCNQLLVTRAFMIMFDGLAGLHRKMGTAMRAVFVHLLIEYQYYLYRKRRNCRLMSHKKFRKSVRDRATHFLEHEYTIKGRVRRHFTEANVKRMMDTASSILEQIK
jgi:hypothetical protein